MGQRQIFLVGEEPTGGGLADLCPGTMASTMPMAAVSLLLGYMLNLLHA
jgi:hypothetical protein